MNRAKRLKDMKKTRFNLSLRWKFIVSAASLVVIVSLMFSWLFLGQARRDQSAQFERRAQSLAENLAYNSEFGVLTGDRLSLEKLLDGILSQDDVIFAIIEEAEGRELASREKEERRSKPVMEFVAPILRRGRKFADEFSILEKGIKKEPVPLTEIGKVRIGMSLKELNQASRAIRQKILLIALFLIFLGGLLAVIFSRRITKPIQKLSEGARIIGEGNLDHMIEIASSDEIGRLAERFNQMSQNLKDKLVQMVNQEKLASIGRLASGVAHEIGNPLSSLLIDAKMLRDRLREDQEVMEPLEAIIDQAERIKGIVRNLLDFSRSPAVELEPVDIKEAVDRTITLISPQLRKSRIDLNLEVSPSLPRVMASKDQLIQVFINLIMNALEAMPTGGGLRIVAQPLTTGSRPSTEADFLEIRFTDTGSGIPQENLDKIFDPFFTTKPVGQGTGLGLAISYQIIRKLGGYIEVESTQDKGTTFIIKLSLAPYSPGHN
ncbi:MAG: HAMP domain-containing protein [Deltaproteobacteria bacterium]|nr:MAG: HAMP domain-containing protein [Deltaproteobacteria bacterium]